MSADGFHVHGPHDHAIEHAIQGHGDSQTNHIALATAILATAGALFSYMGGATQSNAGLYKNEAAIKKTEASNQWNFYQAKSTKQSLAEMSFDLGSEEIKAKYKEKIARYDSEKAVIKKVAEELDRRSLEWDKKSEEQMHQHHRWAEATTALQVAIAMAAIALLTKKRWLEYAMFALSAVGTVIGVLAYLHI